MSFSLKITNADLVIANGQLQQVTGTDKLTQQILKICLTDVGANPLHPSYGSFLSRAVIGNPAPTSAITQIAQSQINTCLINLQQLQQLQIKSFQQVSADEQLAAITGISVLRSTFDQRMFNVKISVLTKGYSPVQTSFVVNNL
jgi:phage baseplate assembly protein W